VFAARHKVYVLEFLSEIIVVVRCNVGIEPVPSEPLEKVSLTQVTNVVVNASVLTPAHKSFAEAREDEQQQQGAQEPGKLHRGSPARNSQNPSGLKVHRVHTTRALQF
jgi:hypothetical protein